MTRCRKCRTTENLVHNSSICRPCHARLERERRRKNPEAIAERNRRYREKARAKVLAAVRDWEARNAGKARARKDLRRKRLFRFWVDGPEEARYYRTMQRLRDLGFDVQVDHIVPVGARDACGLHVAANLRLIFAFDNASKGARWYPRGNEPATGQFVAYSCAALRASVRASVRLRVRARAPGLFALRCQRHD